ncbi:rhodanese-like domain-containing protein [Nitrospira sp. M1]
MDALIQGIAIVGCLAAIGAWIHARRLGNQVERLKCAQSALELKLKAQSQESRSLLEPLRFQLAAVATGEIVPSELIREGCLYRKISAEEESRRAMASGADEQQEVIRIDVRTAQEYEHGHLPGAILIPLEEVEQRYHAEISKTNHAILVYCSNGERSRLACDYLSRQGYLNLYHMYDGLQRWTGELEGELPVNLIQIQSKTQRV